jgi:hypothetical protein
MESIQWHTATNVDQQWRLQVNSSWKSTIPKSLQRKQECELNVIRWENADFSSRDNVELNSHAAIQMIWSWKSKIHKSLQQSTEKESNEIYSL